MKWNKIELHSSKMLIYSDGFSYESSASAYIKFIHFIFLSFVSVFHIFRYWGKGDRKKPKRFSLRHNNTSIQAYRSNTQIYSERGNVSFSYPWTSGNTFNKNVIGNILYWYLYKYMWALTWRKFKASYHIILVGSNRIMFNLNMIISSICMRSNFNCFLLFILFIYSLFRLIPFDFQVPLPTGEKW